LALIGETEMSTTYLLSPLTSLWKILIAYGHDPEPIFLQEGISYDMILKPGKRITFRTIDNLWTKATDLIEDPCFGLQAVDFLHPSNFNALGYAFLASSTLHEALFRITRYARMISGSAEVHIDDTSEGLMLTLSDSLKHPTRLDFAMANLMTLCRLNYGEELNPVTVSFIHPKPACSERHLVFFRAPVHFDAESDSLTLATNDVDKKLPSGNPQLARLNDQVIIKYLARLDYEDITQRVKAAIIEHLPSGKVTYDKISNSLYISVRSLQRRLQQAGTSYRDLLDSTREDLAREYVIDHSVELTEIAFLLGFSEHSAFSRAFKRWTGHSPKEVRKAV
jgi:AraC-like DNA-binding protein